MTFDDIIGEGGRLRDEMRSGQAVHAYLFAGPRGTGKRSLANICAMALNCAGSGDKPCGRCARCRQFDAGNFPDVHRLSPEKSIGVDDVRALCEQLAVRPYEGGRRVAIVEKADRMTVQAQNALLKTLEAPPSGVVIFLLAESTEAMLATIISRCRVVRFRPLSPDAAAEVLTKRGVKPDRARTLAALSGGAVGRALEMNADESYWALRARVGDALSLLSSPSGVPDAFAVLKDDRDRRGEVMALIEGWARDLMLSEDAGDGIVNGDIAARAKPKPNGARALAAVWEAKKRLESNVAWQSALETLFFDLLGG